jgi:predicted PurR-regulated permease PerM
METQPKEHSSLPSDASGGAIAVSSDVPNADRVQQASAALDTPATLTVVATTPTSTSPFSIGWWQQLSPSWHAMALIAALVGVGFLIHALAPVLTPFAFGAILSYVGAPIVSALEKRKVPRAAGAVIVIVAFVGFIAGMVLVVAPLISSEIANIATKMPELIARAQNEWLPWINQTFGLTLSMDLSQLKTLATENKDVLTDITTKIAGSAKLGGQVLLTILINVVLIPVVMFYLLRDWPQLIDGVDDLLPRAMQPTVRALAREIDAVLSEFLRGQGLVMIALATYYCVALKLVGLEFALPVGLVTGLLVFIPYIGYGLGLILGMLAALTQFSTPGPILAVAAVFAIGQVLEGFVLVPYLVGDRIGLHPLAVIFALMAFGQLFGFVGVLLALPLSAALLVAVRMLRKRMAQPNVPDAAPSVATIAQAPPASQAP